MLGRNELHCNQSVFEKIKHDRAQSSQHVEHYKIHAVCVCYVDVSVTQLSSAVAILDGK